MTRRKTPAQVRIRRLLAVVDAYRRHATSTTQKEEAAAELGMDIDTLAAAVADARRMGLLLPHE